MAERLAKVQQSPSKEIAEVVLPKRKPHKPRESIMISNFFEFLFLDKPHVWRPKELRGIKKARIEFYVFVILNLI